MIQRIQTLYILIVLILHVLMVFSPIVKYFGEDWVVLNAYSISDYEKTLPLTILIALVIIINLITVFLYKKRTLQIRLLVINVVLIFGVLFFIGFYTYQILQTNEYKAYYQVACIYPLISIIFTFLAILAIKKDEALVRSMDRIR